MTCEHNKLVAVEDENKDNPLIGKKNPWACAVNGGSDQFSFVMGRVYQCMDCQKKFVIQQMYQLSTGGK